MLFTRDLRVRDHPALCAAAARDRMVPAFVFDDRLLAMRGNGPNRTGFLLDSLHDLDASLRDRGGRLVVRRGDWVEEALRLAHACDASTIHVSDDASAYATGRLAALDAAASRVGVAVERHPGVAIVAPGEITPERGDHFRVFTPYHRRWARVRWRAPVAAPVRIRGADEVAPGRLPALARLVDGARSPDVLAGGESAAWARLRRWRPHVEAYGDHRDDLGADRTSRLSAALHFGNLSPRSVADAVGAGPGADAFVRQLAWRDFWLQMLAARPDAAWHDYRRSAVSWEDDAEAFAAWCRGRTGYPLVDAGMRQLTREGFVHNRARMVVASFLTKDLLLDWRLGARHFLDHLVDGDVANNNLNWQWTAGTGADPNPHRIFNPTVQARRFDPDGTYIRRYVPELAGVAAPAVHDPPPALRRAVGYPDPVVDHRAAVERYRAARRRVVAPAGRPRAGSP